MPSRTRTRTVQQKRLLTTEGPCSIDKLSNLAESRRYLRNALPPYSVNGLLKHYAVDA
jgi:hypothetical protein